MEIKSLVNIDPNELTNVFNLSFSDYFVPIKLTLEQLQKKMISENVIPEYSVGIFDQDKLVGFILHAYNVIDGKKVIYNGGTGVIPAYRGNGLTKKMYEYIIPLLRKENIDYLILEVMQQNIQAIKSYEKSGFSITRHLKCFKGNALIKRDTSSHFIIKELTTYNWPVLQKFWDISPTWQNSIPVVEKLSDINFSIGIVDEHKMVGYVIFNPESKRVQQIAVHKEHRKQGIGNRPLAEVTEKYDNQIMVVNVDTHSGQTLAFFQSIGLGNYANQFEMKLALKEE